MVPSGLGTGPEGDVVHRIDGVADPIKDDPVIPDNPAHALIVAAPEFASESMFRKLRAALSILATEAG